MMCVPFRVCQDASCNERNIASALEQTHIFVKLDYLVSQKKLFSPKQVWLGTLAR